MVLMTMQMAKINFFFSRTVEDLVLKGHLGLREASVFFGICYFISKVLTLGIVKSSA